MRLPAAATTTSAGATISTSFNGHWVVTHAPIDGEQKTDLGGVTDFDYDGKHVGVTGHFDHFGKNFRNTDLGFLNGRVNKNWLYGGFRVSEPDPWKFSQELRRGTSSPTNSGPKTG